MRMKTLPRRLELIRAPATVLANLTVMIAAYFLAFWLRFDFYLPGVMWETLPIMLPAAVVLQYAAFYLFNFTRGWWRYVGVGDFLNALKACAAGSGAFAIFVLVAHRHHYPRSIVLLNGIFVFGLSMSVRLAVRRCATLWTGKKPLVDVSLVTVGG